MSNPTPCSEDGLDRPPIDEALYAAMYKVVRDEFGKDASVLLTHLRNAYTSREAAKGGNMSETGWLTNEELDEFPVGCSDDSQIARAAAELHHWRAAAKGRRWPCWAWLKCTGKPIFYQTKEVAEYWAKRFDGVVIPGEFRETLVVGPNAGSDLGTLD